MSPNSNQEYPKRQIIDDCQSRHSESSILIVSSQGNLLYEKDLEMETIPGFTINNPRKKDKRNSKFILT